MMHFDLPVLILFIFIELYNIMVTGICILDATATILLSFAPRAIAAVIQQDHYKFHIQSYKCATKYTYLKCQQVVINKI
jgi:hypothetical protein